MRIGCTVLILPDAEYSGKFTGMTGKVGNYYGSAKVGVEFPGMKNDCESGLFWFSVEKVIFNDPKTIVLWADGTKTIVSCGEDDIYDYYSGFCAAVVKKLFGSTTHAKKVLGKVVQVQ